MPTDMNIGEHEGHFHRRTSDLDKNNVFSIQIKRSYRCYQATAALVLGVCQILFGLWSLALGIAHTLVYSTIFGQVGFGIWSGTIFCIAGFLCVISYFKRSPGIIASQMIFSIISAVLSLVQLSLGVAAAYMDRFYLINNSTYYPYPVNQPLAAQTPIPPYSGTVVVDSLLAVAAILEGIFAISSSALGCKVVCCNLNFIISQKENEYSSRSYNVKERSKIYECEVENCRKF